MESMMYKPGDKVMIRPDLREYECYYMLSGPKKGKGMFCTVPSMVAQAGKVFIIKKIRENGRGYQLKEYDFGWTDSMFESANECICDSLL